MFCLFWITCHQPKETAWYSLNSACLRAGILGPHFLRSSTRGVCFSLAELAQPAGSPAAQHPSASFCWNGGLRMRGLPAAHSLLLPPGGSRHSSPQSTMALSLSLHPWPHQLHCWLQLLYLALWLGLPPKLLHLLCLASWPANSQNCFFWTLLLPVAISFVPIKISWSLACLLCPAFWVLTCHISPHDTECFRPENCQNVCFYRCAHTCGWTIND